MTRRTALQALQAASLDVDAGRSKPTPPRGTVTYRCDDTIFVRRGEWVTACGRREHPTRDCLCHHLGVPLDAPAAPIVSDRVTFRQTA